MQSLMWRSRSSGWPSGPKGGTRLPQTGHSSSSRTGSVSQPEPEGLGGGCRDDGSAVGGPRGTELLGLANEGGAEPKGCGRVNEPAAPDPTVGTGRVLVGIGISACGRLNRSVEECVLPGLVLYLLSGGGNIEDDLR